MRNEVPKIDSLSQVKLKAFPILVSVLMSITTYMVIEVRSDVKALLTSKAQSDLRLDHLERDVNRLNNQLFYENSENDEPTRKPSSDVSSPKPDPEQSIPNTSDFFITPAATQYEKRKYLAYKGKA